MRRNTVVVIVIVVLVVIALFWCRSALVRTPEEPIQPPAAEEPLPAPN